MRPNVRQPSCVTTLGRNVANFHHREPSSLRALCEISSQPHPIHPQPKSPHPQAYSAHGPEPDEDLQTPVDSVGHALCHCSSQDSSKHPCPHEDAH
eukprot:901641-Amphidinium_carterae.1